LGDFGFGGFWVVGDWDVEGADMVDIRAIGG